MTLDFAPRKSIRLAKTYLRSWNLTPDRPALALFKALKDKLGELASVPISTTHNKGRMEEIS
tara:strand:- start:142 stop:327 length:186 start_codon:yes stop_codon:yes gene_type:complete